MRGFQDRVAETLRDALEVRISSGTASTLNAVSQIVAIDHVSIAANYTLTLPSVASAKGMLVIIRMDTRDGSYSVTVTHNNSDSRNYSNRTLDAAGESIVYMSDGEKWHIMAAVV